MEVWCNKFHLDATIEAQRTLILHIRKTEGVRAFSTLNSASRSERVMLLAQHGVDTRRRDVAIIKKRHAKMKKEWQGTEFSISNCRN